MHIEDGEYHRGTSQAQSRALTVVLNLAQNYQRATPDPKTERRFLVKWYFGKKFLNLSGNDLEEELEKGLPKGSPGDALCCTVYEFDSALDDEEISHYELKRKVRKQKEDAFAAAEKIADEKAREDGLNVKVERNNRAIKRKEDVEKGKKREAKKVNTTR